MLAAGSASAQVQVQNLAAPDLFSVGSSDLPAGLWKGSSAALARRVIPELAARPLTPAAAALARHVLGASANAPDGAGDDAELAGQRTQALLALGDIDTVALIGERTPGLPQRPALSQALALADLARGQEDQACAIGEGLAEGRDGGFWLRLRAFCQARAGQAAPAQLTLDLAGQQGRSADYERLMAAFLAGKDAEAPALDNGLDYALSRHVSAGWSQGLAAAAPPVAVAVARDPAAAPSVRLEAAARAARAGIVVADAYGALQPPPADLTAADQPGAAGEGALAVLARTTGDLSLKEAAVMALLKRAQDGPGFQALARLVQPQIGQLIGAGAVLRRPALIALAAAAAGDGVSAKAARAQLEAKDAARPLPLDLALLDALIAVASGQPDAAAVDEVDRQYSASDAAGRARAGAAIALLAALGASVGPQARLDLSASDIGASSAAGRLRALGLSAADGRVGDVALYALAISADAGVTGPSPADRAAIVEALRLAGLKADAQAMAIEGLVALQARP
jgi:hypothetical protein